MAERHSRYVVDASSWISVEGDSAQNRILYNVGQLIEAGKIVSPPQAWDEVKKCPWVKAWLEQYKDGFVKAVSDVGFFQALGRVTHRFPAMAGARRRKERADQYVLATAIYSSEHSNPTEYAVVCEESAAQRPNRKLVTACESFGVKSMSMKELMRKEFPDEDWG